MMTADYLCRSFGARHSSLCDARSCAARFDRWLAAFWTPFCPPEPDSCPDAVNELDGWGARTIRWYEDDGDVLGYLAGISSRCYRVPAATIVPSLGDVLDEDGPDCDGDDRDLRDREDTLVAVSSVVESVADRIERGLVRQPDSEIERGDLSGRDGWPAGDLFHRQTESDRQVVG